MSEISEILGPCLSGNQTQEQQQEFHKEVMKRGEPPAWGEFNRWKEWNTSSLMRATRFWFNGRRPWDTGEEAITETSEFIQDGVYYYLVNCLTKGILVGSNQKRLGKKYPYEDIFCVDKLRKGKDHWLDKENETAQSLRNDDEVMDLIRNHLIAATAFFTQMYGVMKAEGKDTFRVFDALNAMLKQCSTGMYLAGITTGEKCQEAMTLAELEKQISGFPE